jgi:uncharacterized protein (TIGR03435 family)
MNFTKIWILLGAATAFAQNTPRPAFEVASIRPAAETPPQNYTAGVRIDGAQFRSSYLTLKDDLAMAYRVKIYQISGPDWIGSDRFDMAATIPQGVPTTQIPVMMQSLLEERFQVKLHREKKEFPVYALQLAKGGMKMQASAPDPDAATADVNAAKNFTGGGSAQGVSVSLGPGSSFTFANGRFEAKRVTMLTMAAVLERFLDRPVVDMTDLKGNYDPAFDVTTDDYRIMLVRSAVVAGVVLPPEALRVLDAGSPSSLFDALEKLGLKLEARKAPLDVLVIDGALKTPTSN